MSPSKVWEGQKRGGGKKWDPKKIKMLLARTKTRRQNSFAIFSREGKIESENHIFKSTLDFVIIGV